MREVTHAELVWPGKYDEYGRRRQVDRVSLPFRVIERVNESLTAEQTVADGWRNKLIWGENKLVMTSLLDEYTGKIDLVYIDPPFAVGADFAVVAEIGDGEGESRNERSSIEKTAYRDTWSRGLESYLSMLYERLLLVRELLADTGLVFVHLDWRVGHYGRILMDEVFGPTHFLNEIVRLYAGGGQSKNFFPRKHEPIFLYTRGDRWVFNEDDVRVPYDSDYKATVFTREESRAPGKTYRPHVNGKVPEDWWLFNRPYGSEIVGYPTQKPEGLLERIIKVGTDPGGLVADFFCGSGTTQVAAEKLGRRWIGCDIGRHAIHASRKRLLQIPTAKPFEVLDLGKYERRYWQAATFGRDLDGYVTLILKSYGATPVSGMRCVQGMKERAFVYVGAVDSTVTTAEVSAALAECAERRAKELHVLGWEWTMDCHADLEEEAAAHGIQLILRQIPREIMEERGAGADDIEFSELAHLDVEVRKTGRPREMVVRLENFVVPNPDLVPADIRGKIRKWSDNVDYWAVDWEFSGVTFCPAWSAYRTRQDRSLTLESDPHVYERPGEYSVMVRVINIVGHDTSKICVVCVG
jgi:DNA modification methylase